MPFVVELCESYDCNSLKAHSIGVDSDDSHQEMATPMPPAERKYQLAHIDQTLSPSIIGVNIALPIVATVAVILRLLARRLKKAECRGDDFVLIAALFATYALCVELVLCAHFGVGPHLIYILNNPRTSNVTNVLKMQYAVEMTWNVCTYLVKLSNILLLARLFVNPSSPYFRICLHIVHAFLLLWTLGSFFNAIFRCVPVQSFWDLTIKGSCPHASEGRIATAVLNSVTDVILLSLPMRPLWQLHLPWKRKLQVLVVFVVGFLCLAASAARLNYAIEVSRYSGYDRTYTNASPVIWASVEPCTGIICACLPIMQPLFVDVRTSKWSEWFIQSVLTKFRRQEADTWWHPSAEETEEEDYISSDVTGGGKSANPDWNFMSSPDYKVMVQEEVVSVREIGEAKRSVEIAAKAFDRVSWNLEGG